MKIEEMEDGDGSWSRFAVCHVASVQLQIQIANRGQNEMYEENGTFSPTIFDYVRTSR